MPISIYMYYIVNILCEVFHLYRYLIMTIAYILEAGKTLDPLQRVQSTRVLLVMRSSKRKHISDPGGSPLPTSTQNFD